MLRWFVFLSVAFLYLFNLGLNQVWQPNEAFYADASKNMLKNMDFLTPVYNGEIRLNKPPMTYWLTALSFYLLGINEFALRFFQVLAGLGAGFATYFFARRFYDERTALLSFVVLTLSFQFIANARYTSPEILLTFFTSLSLYLWFLSYKSGSGFLLFLALTSSVMAVLTKGPVGFLMPAGIIFIYLVLTDPRELLKFRYYIGTLYVALVGGWWFLYQYITNREEFVHIFLKENIKRIYALEEDPIYFYLLDINVSFLPYSFIFYIALFWALRKARGELSFPLVWFGTIFVVFSLVKMKIPVYIMPAFPAMAIITSRFLVEINKSKLSSVALSFLTVLMVVAVWVGAFSFEINPFYLLLATILPLLTLAKGYFREAPAVAGYCLLLYLSGVLLPVVEENRFYREIGKKMKEIDPSASIKTYQVGAFHHNLPFYGDRVIIRDVELEDIRPPAIILVRNDLSDCKPLARWKLYKGSESRFFKFLKDSKLRRNFYDFKLCIYGFDM